jgi:hypothetical protein
VDKLTLIGIQYGYLYDPNSQMGADCRQGWPKCSADYKLCYNNWLVQHAWVLGTGSILSNGPSTLTSSLDQKDSLDDTIQPAIQQAARIQYNLDNCFQVFSFVCNGSVVFK